MKKSSKNSEQLNKNFLQTYPHIKADCYIPIGIKCRVAERLRENNLRLCSLPFDWLSGFTLDFVIETIKHGVDTWFVDYVEDNSKANREHRCLYDIKNKFRSRHIFPKNQSIEEYMPEFRKVFGRRYTRFMKILDNSRHICFVCNNRNMPLDDFAIPNVIDDNQSDNIEDFHNFLKKIKKIYPDKQFSLVHVEHSQDEKEFVEYSYADNITIYNLKTFDTVATDDTSTSSWKGNSKTWKNICSNLELTSRNNQSMVAVKN
ncbi:MAG: hypothetical protein ILA52_01655, partial [Alphaproteobacteria bacterium]|nr:hypothetical protein [Alphaproteobacteria bacterium]